MPDYTVTYIPTTEGKSKRFTTIVKDAPSQEAVEQIFTQLQDAGISQLVSVVETFDTTGIHSQVPFGSITVKITEGESAPTDDVSDFTETFYESDRQAAREHAEYPLTAEYIARLERVAKAAKGYWWAGGLSSRDADLYDALAAINFMDEAL